MKKILLTVLLFTGFLSFAQIPAGYYDSAEGLSGFVLKTELSNIISNGHNPQSYGDLWNAYYDSDVDEFYENDGTILDIYSEDPDGQDPYNYSLGNDQCGNYQGEGDCYNREHLFPKSWFNDQAPMFTDIHHIYPTDGSVNGARSNFPFGEVGSANYTSQNGTKRGNNVYDFNGAYTGTVFEPIDEFKGDVARVWLYMATRYESQVADWENNTGQSDIALNGTSDQVFEDWMISMLLNWHFADPVSPKEINRNNEAFFFQGNRNPYIDNPAFVASIWGEPDTENPTAPTNLMADNITDSSVMLSWGAATDNVGVVSYQIIQDAAIVASATNTNFQVIGLTPETTYSFTVVALDAQNNPSTESNTVNITTLEGPDLIFEEDFNDCEMVQFNAISELSDLDWQCTTQFGQNETGAYQMNSFSAGSQIPSTDWLITSNTLNFDTYTEEMISFYTVATFGNSELQLLYSTDYDGSNMPSNSTWLAVPNVTIPLHPTGNNNQVVFAFEDVDVSAISGEVYFAFKYDTSNGEQATRWTVDNFKIEGSENLSVEGSKALKLTIYPNPTQNRLVISLPTAEEFAYGIYDLNGRLLQHNKQQRQKEISVESLAQGLYLLQVSVNGKTATKKLMVN